MSLRDYLAAADDHHPDGPLVKAPVGWIDGCLGFALHASTRSKDPNTKVGAVIVDWEAKRILGVGYTGFPKGVEDRVERWKRPRKYGLVEHAERNAIFNSHVRELKGACLFLSHYPPCQECAKAIVQTGIKRIFTADQRISSQSASQCAESLLILREGGVQVGVRQPALDTPDGEEVFVALERRLEETDPK